MLITTTRFKCDGGQPRPRCTLCSKAYGQRDTRSTHTVVQPGEEMPPHTGDQMMIAQTVLSRPGAGALVTRTLWNGAWFGGYAPFCTLVCALAFARTAHRDGARYTRKTEPPTP